MASAFLSNDRRSARIAIVAQHIRLENEHDLQGVLGTFGDAARYDDEPWGEHYTGRNGVCLFYEQLMKALPDCRSKHSDNMSLTMPLCLKWSFVVRTSAGGVAFLRPGDESSSRYAVSTPSTWMTVSPGKKSTTTGAQCCDNWAFSTSRKACWDESPFWRLIQPQLRVLSRAHSCKGD